VVALGADHAGLPLKETLKSWLVERGLLVCGSGIGMAIATAFDGGRHVRRVEKIATLDASHVSNEAVHVAAG
jgi:ribose 5-phosphate isomerase RpiB